MNAPSTATMLACRPGRETFRRDVLVGLAQRPKRLPCKYFYDQRGSMLFDAICELPEYYLTRSETRIMEHHAREMAAELGRRVMLIEFGSGSSVKTRYLLEALRPPMYVPIDISREHLLSTAVGLRRGFPHVVIQPVCADFAADFQLPSAVRGASRRVVYFPGSTIGNFEPTGAMRLLNHIARLIGQDGGLLVGIDLVKDEATIERAYNDSAGITAEFNRNMLVRINRELGGEFNVDEFEHLAFYDRRFERMDIRLVSKRKQDARVNGMVAHFEAGEAIHTEHSHKYTVERFARVAREAGLKLHRSWTDGSEYFAVLHFVCKD